MKALRSLFVQIPYLENPSVSAFGAVDNAKGNDGVVAEGRTRWTCPGTGCGAREPDQPAARRWCCARQPRGP